MLQTTLERIISLGRGTEQVVGQVNVLIHALNNEELGTCAFVTTLRLKHCPTFIYDYLQLVVLSGLVAMTQLDSPKSPTQKYRLTKKGRSLLKK